MHILKTRNALLATTILSLGFVGSMPAMAAAAAPVPAPAATDDQGGIADIVVTARKSSENQQSVPVSVTALNTAALESRQVLEVTDLARTAKPSGIQGHAPYCVLHPAEALLRCAQCCSKCEIQ